MHRVVGLVLILFGVACIMDPKAASRLLDSAGISWEITVGLPLILAGIAGLLFRRAKLYAPPDFDKALLDNFAHYRQSASLGFALQSALAIAGAAFLAYLVANGDHKQSVLSSLVNGTIAAISGIGAIIYNSARKDFNRTHKYFMAIQELNRRPNTKENDDFFRELTRKYNDMEHQKEPSSPEAKSN